MRRNNIFQQLKNLQRRVLSSVITFFKFLPKKVYLIVGVILVLITLFLILFQSNIFLVSKLEIPDLVYINKSKIENQNRKYLGEKIFYVPVNKIELETFNVSPYIKSVSVQKVLPNKLKFEITERKPKLKVLYTATNEYFLIDNERFVLDLSETTESFGFPDLYVTKVAFEVFDALPEKSGKSLEIKGIDFILQLVKKSPKDIQMSNKQPLILKQKSLEFYLSEGPQVIMDPNKSLEEQLKRLKLILGDTSQKGKKLQYVNVSLEKPYGKYK